ncbi:MAG: HD domain-containing protein [Chitinophagales bacterium]|nr:HD domain-containing protein [Chitinophagales bacterium]
MLSINKKKIFNDPVYGFISIPHEIIFDLVEHPYFQRLRRIRQLGMTHYVYPGALHTRFHHALGALHLMCEAIEELRFKGHAISKEEEIAVCIGILLHDIGHGPYSHTLEQCLVKGISHEFLSVEFMKVLNEEFGGQLTLAIEIFMDRYPKRFLHQLISSQLDMDRLDYLKRDGFYTGVQEGAISEDRIIKMLDVRNDHLVVEAKGIYSVEKFLIARRLMYWQVYLHKTVVGAEQLLVNVLLRAKYLAKQGLQLFATPSLAYFLYNDIDRGNFDKAALDHFAQLDDYDMFTSLKVWAEHEDRVLSILCTAMTHRKLFHVNLESIEVPNERVRELERQVVEEYHLTPEEAAYLVMTGSTSNNAYNLDDNRIQILYKDGRLVDVADATDQLNMQYLSKSVTKYYLCYPKGLLR